MSEIMKSIHKDVSLMYQHGYVKKDEIIKFDVLSRQEGWERVSMVLSILEDRLGYIGIHKATGALVYDKYDLHPCLYSEECKRDLAVATESLLNLYQKLGEWEFVEYSK